jgi:hypothetical protein
MRLESEEDRESYNRGLRRPGRRINDLCKKFLELDPRPTISELNKILAEPERTNRQDLMDEMIKRRGKIKQNPVNKKAKDNSNIRQKENRLRNRLKSLEGVYGGISAGGRYKRQPNKLCKEFLFKTKPKPTIEELEGANYPLGIDTQLHIGCVPSHTDIYKGAFYLPEDSRKSWNAGSSYGIFPDAKRWKEMCEFEKERRRKYMQQIIDSRKQANEARKEEEDLRGKLEYSENSSKSKKILNKFLEIRPKPTIEELKTVCNPLKDYYDRRDRFYVEPLPKEIEQLTGNKEIRVPIPSPKIMGFPGEEALKKEIEKRGIPWLKRRIKEVESQKRRELMQQIIDSRKQTDRIG